MSGSGPVYVRALREAIHTGYALSDARDYAEAEVQRWGRSVSRQQEGTTEDNGERPPLPPAA